MDSVSGVLDQKIGHIGASVVTYQSILTVLFIITLTVAAIIVVRIVVMRAQAKVSDERRGALFIIGQLVRYIIVFAGVVATGSSLSLDLSSFSLFAGALGVGVGLGLQDVIKNFVCGLILMFDRSIEVSDYIELDDGTIGEVIGIGSRATTILTNDNVDVLQPNSVLLSGKLTNWTRNRRTRRVHIPFGVAYGSDKEKVREAILEAAAAVPFTLPDDGHRRTQVWLTSFVIRRLISN
jgi:small-conductance mechanosensitive channel